MENRKQRRQHYGECLHGKDGYRTDNCQRKLRKDVRLYLTSSLQNSAFFGKGSTYLKQLRLQKY